MEDLLLCCPVQRIVMQTLSPKLWRMVFHQVFLRQISLTKYFSLSITILVPCSSRWINTAACNTSESHRQLLILLLQLFWKQWSCVGRWRTLGGSDHFVLVPQGGKKRWLLHSTFGIIVAMWSLCGKLQCFVFLLSTFELHALVPFPFYMKIL